MNNANQSQIRSFRSIDGGASWRATVLVSSVSRHTVAGGPADQPAALGRDGCGRHGLCGLAGLPVPLRLHVQRHRHEQVDQRDHLGRRSTRVPIDATCSTVDHFIPGLGVDRSTSGASARLGLTYYYYPTAACTSPPAS